MIPFPPLPLSKVGFAAFTARRWSFSKFVQVFGAALSFIIVVIYYTRSVTKFDFSGLNLRKPPGDKLAIVVLGGGLTETGNVPQHTQLRLDRAKELYLAHPNAIIITTSGGTPHKPPPLDSYKFPIAEATAAAHRLMAMGIPPSAIHEEAFSLDTLGNAYFLRTVHLEPSGIRNVIIITNDWHMPRTKAYFQHVFSIPVHEGDQGSHDFAVYSLSFEAVDPGLEGSVLATRREKELKSLRSFVDQVKQQFNSLSEMNRFIFEQHQAYAASRLLHTPPPLDPELLKTY